MNIIQSVLSAITPLPDGDLSDRLNYTYTTTILIVCSAFISTWSFVGQPIQCWFPAFFRGWWMEYALDYCYVQNTYFVSFTEVEPDNYFDIAKHVIEIPKNVTDRDHKQIGYYQWVPFILALQGLLFYLPVVLWRTIYNSAGFKVRTICETCNIRSNMDPSERLKNMEIIARFLIYDHDITKSLGGRIKQALEGRIVCFTYITVKVIYALNALFQFLLIKWLLGTDSIFWGWNVANDLAVGNNWPQTGNFPRVTLCDFSVRVLGNLHRYSVQCVLMINMFNEKIFVFLWFWFCFIAVYSVGSFFYWLLTSLRPKSNESLIRSYIEKTESNGARAGILRQMQTRNFISRTLRPDGLFLIRLIAINSGDLVTCELIATLWRDYLATLSPEQRRALPPPYEDEAPVPLLLNENGGTDAKKA